MAYLVGVDVGGTFTDLIAVDTDSGVAQVTKAATTPSDPSVGFLDALRASQIAPQEIAGYLVHGTTLGTNAIVERRGPAVGLICTAGFRDVLETRRWWRPHLYDNTWNRPVSLVPRRRRIEVLERVDYTGAVVEPLDLASVERAVTKLRDDGVESYAVALLFSYLNPDHERAVREMIEKVHPEASVSLSSDVLPEVREYERTSTTVLNAFLKPLFSGYLDKLTSDLAGIEVAAPLWILKSNCGIMTPERTVLRAVDTIESGPAGGVRATVEFSRLYDAPNLIAFDVGGTTADVSIVRENAPVYKMEHEVEWNIPVRTRMADIQSIGAGGGSIAWVDSGGALRVGPQSAGADPGPACFSRGGSEPTVTDAELVLGRLDDEYFLGGRMAVDRERAVESLETVARPLAWSADDLAVGVHRIALANMARLVREVTVNRGHDPRDFGLICFGGGGGLFAAELADELGIPTVYIPPDAAVFSALGGTLADVVEDYVQTHVATIASHDPDSLERVFVELEQKAVYEMARDQQIEEPQLERSVDLRYVGESYDLTLAFDPADEADLGTLPRTVEAFHKLHDTAYGFSRLGEAVEVVALRVRATKSRSSSEDNALAGRTGHAGYELKGTRRCWVTADLGFIDVPLYRQSEGGAMLDAKGPLLVETPETTVVVRETDRVRTDARGTLEISIADA